MHMASPSRASSVISGPVISPICPPTRSMMPYATGRLRRGQLTRLPDQGVARAVLLPAAAVAAGAAVPAGHDLHMAELARDAVLAALDLAVLEDRAADAGTERDHDEVVLAAAGAEAPLAPGGGVGVVVDHDGHGETCGEGVACSGSSRQARCGANSTRERSASTQPAAPMPDGVHVVPVGEVQHQLGDGVLDDLGALGLVRGLGAYLLQDVARRRRRRPPSPWCRRCRCRRSAPGARRGASAAPGCRRSAGRWRWERYVCRHGPGPRVLGTCSLRGLSCVHGCWLLGHMRRGPGLPGEQPFRAPGSLGPGCVRTVSRTVIRTRAVSAWRRSRPALPILPYRAARPLCGPFTSDAGAPVRAPVRG